MTNDEIITALEKIRKAASDTESEVQEMIAFNDLDCTGEAAQNGLFTIRALVSQLISDLTPIHKQEK